MFLFPQMKPLTCLSALILLITSQAACGDTWTDPAVAAREEHDFLNQGEYGVAGPGQPWAVQVVALGNGHLDAYLLEGGFPGLGYIRGNQKIKLSGIAESLVSADGKIIARISDGAIEVVKDGETLGTFKKVERKSETLGKPAPEGAIVLFDGSNAGEWENGKVVEGLLANNDPKTKRKFGDYFLHLEFRTPYKPEARGQARGNSGVYHQHRYETQVLDAFGLEGEDNETGGIYKVAKPIVNMCLPPLTWQTYDIDFTAAKFDENGKKTANARITVKLNGVLIHDDIEIPAKTGGGKPETPEPGPIYLQSHGNPVFYKNIWLMEK